MSIHYFSPDSLLNRIVIRKAETGGSRAYLFAQDSATKDDLAGIVRDLVTHGYQAVPAQHEGKPALEVRGFRKPQELFEELASYKCVKGYPTAEPEKIDKLSFVDKVRKQSLFLSSLAYLIGDANFFMYGRKEKQGFDMAAGIFYGCGTLGPLLFGRKDPSDISIREASKKLSEFAHQQGFVDGLEAKTFSPGAVQSSLKENASQERHDPFKRIYDTLRKHPADILNGSFALAGICIAIAASKKLRLPPTQAALEEAEKLLSIKSPHLQGEALKNAAQEQVKSHIKFVNRMDLGLGSTTFASGLYGILAKEKQPDPNHPAASGGWDKAKEWIKAHPLAITAGGYMVSTGFHAISTASELFKGDPESRKAVINRGVFVASNLLAELLVSISSKNHTKNDGKANDHTSETVIAIAADLIAKQPELKQKAVTQYFAGFLCLPEVLNMKKDEVLEKLSAAVETSKANPWALAWNQLSGYKAPSPELPEVTSNAWQNRITSQAHSSPGQAAGPM